MQRQSQSNNYCLMSSLSSPLKLTLHLQICCFLAPCAIMTEAGLVVAEWTKRQSLQSQIN